MIPPLTLVGNVPSICKKFKFSRADVKNLVKKEITPQDFVQCLLEKGLYKDALHFLAHGLEKTLAIRWAFSCLKNSPSHPALNLVASWIENPQEVYRRELEVFMEDLNYEEPLSWLISAIVWSGGSLTPEGQPEVLPQDNLTGHAVAGCLFLTAVQENPYDQDKSYQNYSEQAFKMAEGK